VNQKKKKNRPFSSLGDAKPPRSSLSGEPDRRGAQLAATDPIAAAKAAAAARWNREAIESVIIAVVLAFLFRAFEAEAFVIPTGSMAPTLRGRYLSVQCEKCGNWHQVGASIDEVSHGNAITQTLCPMCQHPNMTAEPVGTSLVSTYPGLNGDRILVNKFAYDSGDPQRWDVIVFKFPANAKQNYIKRLVGLPNESLRIEQGDVYTRGPNESEWTIQRKPPAKLWAMLQPVHDSHFVSDELIDCGWPTRWQPQSNGTDNSWQTDDHGRSFSLDATASTDLQWLRYEHTVAATEYWQMIEDKEPLPTDDIFGPRPSLITDFYAYNAKVHYRQNRSSSPSGVCGAHWVGDLAVTCDVELKSDGGVVALELIESTQRYQCHFDLKTGQARLLLVSDTSSFDAVEGASPSQERQASTFVRGNARHQIKFANVDNQLFVWVDGKHITFDGPTTFSNARRQRPRWSQADPGDLSPIGLGIQGASATVHRLQVQRDIYYVAVKPNSDGMIIEYSRPAVGRSLDTLSRWMRAHLAPGDSGTVQLDDYFRFPEAWSEGDLFDQRGAEEFDLHEDQFFPMGDNSPSSKDARIWEGDHYVPRELLLGKAFMIYYPQGQIPGFPGRMSLEGVRVIDALPPDFTRMGLIR